MPKKRNTPMKPQMLLVNKTSSAPVIKLFLKKAYHAWGVTVWGLPQYKKYTVYIAFHDLSFIMKCTWQDILLDSEGIAYHFWKRDSRLAIKKPKRYEVFYEQSEYHDYSK